MKKRICACILTIALLLSPTLGVYAQKNSSASTEGADLVIASAEDLLRFAKTARLDTAYKNKRVVLAKDIKLKDVNFPGIPTFAGTFDGLNHKITGLTINENNNAQSYSGLFSMLQKDAVIENLEVQGTVSPSGSPVIIGGIVGDNSGTIVNCSFSGTVVGTDYVGGIVGKNEIDGHIADVSTQGFITAKHFTGGIAGCNYGLIERSDNDALVNTFNEDMDMNLKSLQQGSLVQSIIISAKQSNTDEANMQNTVTDCGGISGISSGVIRDCINNGTVGYEHVGYNIGGIVGRQSGYVFGSTNNGKVYGRKDVGGIVGQAEPTVTPDLSKDMAEKIKDAINKLDGTVGKTIDDAKAQSTVLSNRLTIIQQFTTGAIEDVRYISANTIDYTNAMVGSGNELYNRVDYITDQAARDGGMLDQAKYADKDFKNSFDNFKKSVDALNIRNAMSEADRNAYDNAKNSLDAITAEYEKYTADANSAYYNYYVSQHKADRTGTTDLVYQKADGSIANEAAWTAPTPASIAGVDIGGKWIHSTDSSAFPGKSVDDVALHAAASAYGSANTRAYANMQYSAKHPGSTYATDTLLYSTAMTDPVVRNLDTMSGNARSNMSSAINELKGGADHLNKSVSDASSITKNIAGRDDVTFPTFSEEYKMRTNSLSDNLRGMNDNFGLLNTESKNASDVVLDDIRKISSQFTEVLRLYSDAIEEIKNMDSEEVFNDRSLEVASSSNEATIDTCRNYGDVEGDIDIAGIAGTMAIDYDYDAEGDITGIKDSGINASYTTKCVLRDNTDYGNILSQKNYVGGITGLQEMGTILDCTNYGNIESKAGEYAGGVAGSSLSHILSSYSRGIITAKGYVGGIAGHATNLKNCFALVKIKDADRWYGAVAGHKDEKSDIVNNWFVSDELAGIDRVSYSGMAEPTAYEDMYNKLPEIPGEFHHLNVSFEIEDEDGEKTTIEKEHFDYGSSLTSEDFPKTNAPKGSYALWDNLSLESIVTDEAITATYEKYRTSLSSNDIEDRNQSELLVDGAFVDTDQLEVSETKYEFKHDSRVNKDVIDVQMKKTFKVKIPDDGQKTHQIRFHPILDGNERQKNSYTIYQVLDDDTVMKLKKTGEFGIYDLYNVEGNQITLMVVHTGLRKDFFKGAAGIIAAVFGIAFLVIVLLKLFSKHGEKIPVIHDKIKGRVITTINNKEQLFYDESAEENVKEENASGKNDSEEKTAEENAAEDNAEVPEGDEKKQEDKKQSGNHSSNTEKPKD